jgi:hypothetical protein
MTLSHLFDPRRFVAIVLSMLLVAPLGLGLPLLVGSQTEYGFGVFAMILLIAPSIWSSGALTRRLGQPSGTPTSYLIGGCFGPLLALFLFGFGFAAWDTLCESDAITCGNTSLWLMTGLVWISAVFVWVWGTSVLKQEPID